jgi:hypothetical protein
MSGRLKIGLIVDGEKVSRHVFELAQWARSSADIHISHLIVQTRPPPAIRRRGILAKALGKSPAAHATVVLWKTKTMLESRALARMKAYRGHNQSCEIGDVVPGRIHVTPLVSKSGFVHRFSEDDVEKIRREEFDVLIRCGSGILKGSILTSARLGILSFHHGDNRINRGGPAGFWEVFHRQEKTGFIVQRLTEELDGGDVILRGYIPTQRTHLLNAAMLFAKSWQALRLLLLDIARTGELPLPEPHYPYSGKLFVQPRLHELTSYLLKQAAHSATARARRLLRYQERWGICYAPTDWRHAVFWRGKQVKTPPGHFLADPFVATRAGRTCVFAEDFDYRARRAHIGAFELTDEGARPLGIALRENFHLSFPFLFEADGRLFMCPESREAKQIRIYECTEFPLQWELVIVAMKDVQAVDSMIFRKGDLWWLMTNISRTEPHECGSELHLFWARTPLTEEWTPHARNPIVADPQMARNGGLLNGGAELYRVAQNRQFGSYGTSARLFQIMHIDPKDYTERLVSTILPSFAPGISGTHHLHSNGLYSVWDFKKWERI